MIGKLWGAGCGSVIMIVFIIPFVVLFVRGLVLLVGWWSGNIFPM